MAEIQGGDEMVAIAKGAATVDVDDERVEQFCKSVSGHLQTYAERLSPVASVAEPTSAALTEDECAKTVCYVRCLRNLCPTPDHQSIIGESKVVVHVCKLLELLLTMADKDHDAFTHWPLVRVLLQLCGNLVVRCHDNVDILWPLLFPAVLIGGVSSRDAKTTNVTAMIVNSCITVDPSRRSYLYTDTSNGRRLLSQLLLAAKQPDLEWPLLLAERLVSGSDFPSLFNALQDLYLPACVVLLDLLNATLSDHTDTTVSPSTTTTYQSGNAVFAETALFLAAQCAVWCDRLPLTAPAPADLTPDVSIALSMVQYMSYLSSREDGRHILMTHPAIFTTVLRTLSRLTPRTNKADKAYATEEEGKKSTYHGLKRDLVRCIANLMAMDMFKDQLCAEEGMAILLNNCRVDHCNPYLGQWSVLAIHNACENHSGNQAVVAGLKRQGSADVSMLRKMGVDVDIGDDGTVRMKAKMPDEP